jgi:uncharacterized membrane protein YdjX (TVP38/TMEM64 family)
MWGPRRRAALLAAAALVVVAALVAGGELVRSAVPALTDPAALAAFVHGFGVWAPVAYVLLQAAQVVLAPVPGQVVGFAGGYLFGAVPGTVYSLVGLTLGSAVAFWLARRYGRPWVGRLVGRERMDRFDDVVARDGRVAVFLLFLVPGLPDDALCFVAGLTDIRFPVLVALALVGRAPSTFLVALSGSSLAEGRLALFAAVTLVLVAVSVAGYLSRNAIADCLARA